MKIKKFFTMKTPLGIEKKNTVSNNVTNNENMYSDNINQSNSEEFGFYEFGEDDDDYDDYNNEDDDYIYPRRKKKPKIPALVQFGKDLTLQAKNGDMDLISGREKETNELIEVLCRRRKNNAVLIGEPGVGKTAVAEGLAQKIAFGYVPLRLIYKRVISLDLTLLIAGTRYRGEFEARMRRIIEETRQDPNVILFIDEMHNLIGAGAAEGAMDAANIFKPPLARGELQCIGATTLDEYKKYVERDPALQRRFQTINVCEPSVDQTFKILKNLRNTFETFHDVSITDEGLLAAAEFSSQFIPDRFLPDKAIDLLDQASSRANLSFNSKDGGNRYIEYERESINCLSILKNEALRQGNLDIIRPLSNLEDSWRNELTKYMYLLEIKRKEQDELIHDAFETARKMPKFTQSTESINIIDDDKDKDISNSANKNNLPYRPTQKEREAFEKEKLRQEKSDKEDEEFEERQRERKVAHELEKIRLEKLRLELEKRRRDGLNDSESEDSDSESEDYRDDDRDNHENYDSESEDYEDYDSESEDYESEDSEDYDSESEDSEDSDSESEDSEDSDSESEDSEDSDRDNHEDYDENRNPHYEDYDVSYVMIDDVIYLLPYGGDGDDPYHHNPYSDDPYYHNPYKGEDSDRDSEKDSDKDSEKDSDTDSDTDSDKDSEKDSDKDSEKDSDTDSDTDSDKDSEKDSDTDSDTDSDKDSDKDSNDE